MSWHRLLETGCWGCHTGPAAAACDVYSALKEKNCIMLLIHLKQMQMTLVKFHINVSAVMTAWQSKPKEHERGREREREKQTDIQTERERERERGKGGEER